MRCSGRLAEPCAQRTHRRGRVEVLPGGQGPGDETIGPDERRIDVDLARVDPSAPRGRGFAGLRTVDEASRGPGLRPSRSRSADRFTVVTTSGPGRSSINFMSGHRLATNRWASSRSIRSENVSHSALVCGPGRIRAPVGLVGRIRSDRVMRLPKPSIKEYALVTGQGGRPPKHGNDLRFANSEGWPEAAITTVIDTTNYGKAEAQAWDRLHLRPGRACRSAHRARTRCHQFGGGGPGLVRQRDHRGTQRHLQGRASAGTTPSACTPHSATSHPRSSRRPTTVLWSLRARE
jgi:hypothetical protein